MGGAWVPVLANNHAHSALRYRGHVGASLVVGGVDVTGPQLYSVHPHGSYSRLPFTALGERLCRAPTNPAPGAEASRLPCVGRPAYLRCPFCLQAPARTRPWRCWRTGSSPT